MHQFRPPGENECGITLPLPVPFDTIPNDTHWWEGHWEYDEVVDYCWGDAIEQIELKEINGVFDLTIHKKIKEELTLRFTKENPLVVHGKKLKANSRINNDITTDQPFAVTLDVKKTKSLRIESYPYLIGRMEQRPMMIDIVKGNHSSMKVLGSLEELNDKVTLGRQVKRFSDSSFSLMEGRDEFIVEPGIKFKGRSYLNIGSIKVVNEIASYIPDGDIDKIKLPTKIKGGGELFIQGYGEEDTIDLGISSYSYSDLKSDKTIIPDWLLIENINWFNWMD